MKKIVTIFGIFVCAAILLLNVSLNEKSSSNSTDLSTLAKISKANAECTLNEVFELNSGRCSVFDNCYWDPGYYHCDPWQ